MSSIPSSFRPTKDPHSAALEDLFISISGLIGAGKTTLATELGKVLNIPTYYEPVIDNSYLGDFYKDMAKYGFQLQIYLLNRRFQQHQQIVWSSTGGVQDRTIYEDAVFAKMLRDGGFLDARDYDTYISLFSNMSNFMRKPNVIVHLDVTPEESMRRIKLRSRGIETGITVEYLTALHAAYEDFLSDISRVIPVIRVNWNEFRDAKEMAKVIYEEYLKMHNIREVGFKNQGPIRASPKMKVVADKTNDEKKEEATNQDEGKVSEAGVGVSE